MQKRRGLKHEFKPMSGVTRNEVNRRGRKLSPIKMALNVAPKHRCVYRKKLF